MDAFLKEFGEEETRSVRGWRMVEKVSGFVKNTWASLLKGMSEGGRGGGGIVRLGLYQGARFWWWGRMCLGSMKGV